MKKLRKKIEIKTKLQQNKIQNSKEEKNKDEKVNYLKGIWEQLKRQSKYKQYLAYYYKYFVLKKWNRILNY